MRLTEFKPDDIVDYLNQELPGFEPALQRDDSVRQLTLRVRGSIRFASYAHLPDEFLSLSIAPNYRLKQTIDEFIRKTRQDAIHKLGLQKQIDEEVQRRINAERQRIENEAYRKAMNDALSRVAKEQEKAREELAAGIWNTFMGRSPNSVPVESDADDDLLPEE